jgi:hypothetical protein
MTAEQVITAVYDHAAEYIEMTNNPTALVVGIMAHKIVELEDYIQYLEKRLKNDKFS